MKRIYSLSLITLSLCVFQFLPSYCQSPYDLDWTQDGIIIGTGIGIGAVSLIINNNVKNLTDDEINNLNKNDINGFDRFAVDNYSHNVGNVSNYALVLSIASPAFFLLSEKMREDWFTISVMYGESLMASGILTYLTKGTAQRIRPYVYNPGVPNEPKYDADNRMSFFSGHTSLAFSSAVFLSVVYSDYYPDSDYKPYIWGASLLLASGIGIMRIESGKHFPTDVIVGALVGSASGYLIPYLHRTGNKDDGVSFNFGINGVGINYKF